MHPMPGEVIYLFRHALLREAGYQLQPPGLRAQLHGLALDIMLDLTDDHDALAPELLAHADAALSGVAPESGRYGELRALAVRFATSGAAYARGRFDHAEALRLLRRVADDTSLDGRARVRALVDMCDVLGLGGHIDERRRRADAALKLAESTVPELLPVALTAVAKVELRQGRLEQSRATFLRAMGLTTDDELRARIIGNLGLVAQAAGDAKTAISRYEEALDALRATGQVRMVCVALANLAQVLLNQGELGRGRQCVEEGLQIARRVDDPWLIANHLALLAQTEAMDGRPLRQIELVRESISYTRRTNDLGNLAKQESGLARLLLTDGTPDDLPEADGLSRNALRLAGESGQPFPMLHALIARSMVQARLGEFTQARRTITEAERLNGTGNFGPGIATQIHDTLAFIAEQEA